MLTYTIPDETIQVIKDFAVQYYDTKEVYQSKRKKDAHDRQRRIDQTIMGKMAEEAVAYHLATDTKPDYTMYETGTLMSEPDLRKDDAAIHVKSTSSLSLGWTADPTTDHIVRNPSTNDVLALTEVDLDARTVTLWGFVLCRDVTHLWTDCVADFMNAKGKRAVYWPDLNFKEGRVIPAT